MPRILIALIMAAPTLALGQALGDLKADNNLWGNGLWGVNQPCQWGSGRSVATEGDEEIKEKLAEIKDKKKEQKEAIVTHLRAKREYEAVRRKLQLAIGDANQWDAADFIETAYKCQKYYAESPSCDNTNKRESCFANVEAAFSEDKRQSRQSDQCKHAIWASWQGSSGKSKNLNTSEMCVGPQPRTGQPDVSQAVNQRFSDTSKLAACKDAAASAYLVAAAMKDTEGKASAQEYKNQLRELENDLKDLKKQKVANKKLDDDIRKLERELGESDDDGSGNPGMRDNGNCSFCSIMQAALAQRREEAKMMAWTNIIDTAIYSGAYAWSANQASKRNTALGYPMGVGAWAPQMGFGILGSLMNTYGQYQNSVNSPLVIQMGTGGYPFANGGTYGGINGSMGGGGYGCAPTIYMANGTGNMMMGNNIGGVYNGGYIPGYGFPGAQAGAYARPGVYGPGMPTPWGGAQVGWGAGAGGYPGYGGYPPGMYPPGAGGAWGGAGGGYPPGYAGGAWGGAGGGYPPGAYPGAYPGYPGGAGGAWGGGTYDYYMQQAKASADYNQRMAEAAKLNQDMMDLARQRDSIVQAAQYGGGNYMAYGPGGGAFYGAGAGAYPPGFGYMPGMGFNASINAGFNTGGAAYGGAGMYGAPFVNNGVAPAPPVIR